MFKWLWAWMTQEDLQHRALMAELNRIEWLQYELLGQGREIMAGQQDITDAVGRLNDATNAEAAQIDTVATVLTDLRAQIQNGLDPAAVVTQLDGVTAKLAAQSDRLKGLAADPANPVPTPAPPVA